jgi:hypothetical protein
VGLQGGGHIAHAPVVTKPNSWHSPTRDSVLKVLEDAGSLVSPYAVPSMKCTSKGAMPVCGAGPVLLMPCKMRVAVASICDD